MHIRTRSRLALRETFNFRLTITVMLIAVSQFNFGFEQQGFAATQAMDAFVRQFGVYDVKSRTYVIEPYWLSLFNSLNYISFGFGIILGSWVSRRYGRRMCMFTMSLWALVAATIVISSQNRDQIMAGRILNYIYIGMELSVVPIYQSEIVPSQARGFVVATYQVSLVTGSLIINCICRGTSTLQDNSAWRIPLGLFYVIPTLVASCIWFVPESPRWLVMKDRHDEALLSLGKFRAGKFTDEQITAEFEVIKASVGRQLETKQGSFSEQFQKSNIRRTIIVVAVNFFLQATGQIFTTIYGAVYVKSLGTVNPFNITITTSLVNLASGILAMFLIEKVGRRRLLMIGGCIQCLCLMTMGGLGTANPPTYSTKVGIIAMMVIFSFGFSVGWAPIVHTLSAEIPATPLRDMSYRTCSVVNIVMQFVVSFTLPYLLYAPYANLNSKVGFIFGSFAVLSVVFAYFCVPEVQGRTLEEIDKLFEMKLPTRQFRHAQTSVVVEMSDTGLKEDVIHVDVRKSEERA